MIVCICKGITDSTIREMLTYTDLQGIKDMTGACTQCQKCCDALKEIAREQEEKWSACPTVVDGTQKRRTRPVVVGIPKSQVERFTWVRKAEVY